MKIVNIAGGQGSAAWLQFRSTRFGSSEAAAMLGLSSTTTRTELLRIKHTGMEREFSDWLQRHVLDKGHAVEAATRPMVEVQIDDVLYPVVCQGEGRLAASCDGLTIDGALAWECKQWNDALAAEVAAGRVPDTHMPQCQHILLVTGAQRLLFTVSDGTGDRIVSVEVLPSAQWFQRLRDGWAQFERDLAAYTPPAAAEPAPVGKSPDTLPALRIEVTGAVTASNLAEFKATALTAIRGVNRDLKTDADFADADKAVKWCADVESRLKAAKEHALSQTADIDALFKTLDDISAEARSVRLDLDKLVTRRKVEVKEHAVLSARKALDQHVADLNGELAPMRLLPVAADFPAAIKGLRSIASMQDALDTTLANAKIAADAQARVIRSNLATFKAQAAGLEMLFSDLGQLVHKAGDDFAALVGNRIAAHRAAEAAKEAKRQADEAARIAAAEQRAREQEAARIEAEQANAARVEAERIRREQAEAALQQAVVSAVVADSRLLSDKPATALAPAPTPDMVLNLTRPGPSLIPVDANGFMNHSKANPAPATNEPATLNLGAISARLGFTLSAAFVGDTLRILPAATDKAAKLYRESQFEQIVRALQDHLSRVLDQQRRAA